MCYYLSRSDGLVKVPLPGYVASWILTQQRLRIYFLLGSIKFKNFFVGWLMKETFYNSYSSYLTKYFGCRVHKISLDAGMTCPNRDGSKGTGGCAYCDAKGSGSGAYLRSPSIEEQILQGKTFLKRRFGAQKFIAYFQSFSNTYAPIPIL